MQAAKLLLLAISLLPSSVTFAESSTEVAPKLLPFEAEYTAYRFGRDLGYATLSLQAEQDNQFRLDYYSKVSVFFLSDKRSEVSLFSYLDGKILPKTYIYERTGTGSNKSIGIEFSNQDKQIKINNGTPITWQNELDNQLYRLDTQLKLASGDTEFSYDIVNNRGSLRHYDLKVVGEETLELPYGKLNSIKVKLGRENSSRETLAWFAPTLNYQLVRLQQFKDGDEQGEIQLKSFKFTSNPPPKN